MRKLLLTVLAASFAAAPVFAQVKKTHEQMMFYTSDWKGERFPDGRPKVPDDLLKRAVDVSIEDVWDYLRDKGTAISSKAAGSSAHRKALRRARADGAVHAAAARHG